MSRDLGVQADYVERAFRKPLAEVGRDTSHVARVERERAKQHAIDGIAALHATKPLKPPSKVPEQKPADEGENWNRGDQ